MKNILAISAVSLPLLFSSCGGDAASPTQPTTTPTPTPVATSVTLSVTSLSLASLGVTSQLSATVKDQNGAAMTGATVTWATADAAVATVSSAGLVTSVADGTATITATSGSLSATASVTVAQAGANLVLSDSILTFGSLADTTQLTASVTDANGETVSGATVTWATSDAAVATVSSAGLVTSVADGTVTITATSGSLAATTGVTVSQVVASVGVSGPTLSFNAWGETAQLTASVTDANGETVSGATVTWATSDSAVATVSSAGLVTSIGEGSGTITAASGSASTPVSVTGVDTRVPEVSWTRTSAEYDGELYGEVVLTVTATDNYGIDSLGFFIDGAEAAYSGCGGATTGFSGPITGVTATCSDTTAVFAFTWNSTASAGGQRPIKTAVYDATVGNSRTLVSSLTLMHQPLLKYVNLLLEKTVVNTKTGGGVVLTTDTVAAQDSISGYARIPSTDSTRVNWDIIRVGRVTDAAPYGEAIAGSWGATAPSNKRYTIDNVIGSTTYYAPLWRNSGGHKTVPYIDMTLGSEVNICWSSSWARFLCAFESDSVRYKTGYYEHTGSSDAAFRKYINSTTVSSAYWHWDSAGIESGITTGSGATDFHCSASCGAWFDGSVTGAGAGATDQTEGLADGLSPLGNTRTINVMIAGEMHTFLANTDHLRTPGDSDDYISESPGMVNPMRGPVLDSNPVTRPLGGETIPNQARGGPPR
jgi:uncharacterized protein YjdB